MAKKKTTKMATPGKRGAKPAARKKAAAPESPRRRWRCLRLFLRWSAVAFIWCTLAVFCDPILPLRGSTLQPLSSGLCRRRSHLLVNVPLSSQLLCT